MYVLDLVLTCMQALIVQKALVRLLAGVPLRGHKTGKQMEPIHLTIVGDDDQSIYGFRGALPDAMADLEGTMMSVTTVKVCSLTVNYRSTQGIVDECQSLMWPYNDPNALEHLPTRGKHGHRFSAAEQNASMAPAFTNHVARCTAVDVAFSFSGKACKTDRIYSSTTH